MAETLTTFGALLFLGFAIDALGRRTRLPRVTLMMIFGFIIGPEFLQILPADFEKWYPAIVQIALVMLGFLLGEKLSFRNLHEHGRSVLIFSIVIALTTTFVVFFGLVLFRVDPPIALILASIAAATAPAATYDVIKQFNAKGSFSKTLLGIVALDDVWGLVVFVMALVFVGVWNGSGASMPFLLKGLWEIGGAFILGTVLGIPMSYLTGRIRDGEPTIVEALGLVFLCGGLALYLDVSFLLAAMVMGFWVANLAKHYTRPFHAIEDIEWPFLVLFFILAGATVQIDSIWEFGIPGLVFIGFRAISRILGGYLGGLFSHAPLEFKKWMGLSLMPQAGIALGMALIASERYPDIGGVILPIVIGTTVFFEIIGPYCTQLALQKVGDVGPSEIKH